MKCHGAEVTLEERVGDSLCPRYGIHSKNGRTPWEQFCGSELFSNTSSISTKKPQLVLLRFPIFCNISLGTPISYALTDKRWKFIRHGAFKSIICIFIKTLADIVVNFITL